MRHHSLGISLRPLLFSAGMLVVFGDEILTTLELFVHLFSPPFLNERADRILIVPRNSQHRPKKKTLDMVGAGGNGV